MLECWNNGKKYNLQVTAYGLRVTSCGLQVATYRLKDQNLECWNTGIMEKNASCKLQVTGYRLKNKDGTGCKL